MVDNHCDFVLFHGMAAALACHCLGLHHQIRMDRMAHAMPHTSCRKRSTRLGASRTAIIEPYPAPRVLTARLSIAREARNTLPAHVHRRVPTVLGT